MQNYSEKTVDDPMETVKRAPALVNSGTYGSVVAVKSPDWLGVSHPEYGCYTGDRGWQFWRDSEIGGQVFIEGDYLVEHPREREESSEWYDFRRSLATYESAGKDTASDWTSRLYGPGTDISLVDYANAPKGISEAARSLSANIDANGTDLINFFKKITYRSLCFGSYGVFVDVMNPSKKDSTMTIYEAEKAGVRPVLKAIPPWSVLDWEKDDSGSLLWVKICEQSTLPRSWDTPFDVSVDAKKFFLVDRDKVVIYETTDGSNYIPTRTTNHGLGYVPFFMTYWISPESGKMFQRPLIEEIYLIQYLLYNLQSGISETEMSQMFSIFVVSTSGMPNSFDKEIKLGKSRALGISASDGFPPFFASPDPGLIDAHLKVVEHYENRVRKLSKGLGLSMIDNKVREASGRSKAYDVDSMTNLLRDVGDTLEPQFLNILKCLHDRSIFRTSSFSGRSKFPDSHLLRGVIEEAEETIAVCNVLAESKAAVKAKKQKFASTTLRGEVTEETMAEILGEITGEILLVEKVGEQPQNGESNDGAERKDRQADGTKASQEQPGRAIRRVGTSS